MARLAALLFALFLASPVLAQAVPAVPFDLSIYAKKTDVPSLAPAPDLTPYAKKTDVPALAPVQSVTGRTGMVPMPTICGNATIPAGNTVSNTAAETAFTTNCLIPANTPAAGNVVHLHVGGVYSAGTAQNARGKVHMSQSGTLAPATDPILIDTGSVGGLAASTNQEWFGDVWITFLTGAASIDVQGALVFQTGANASVTVPVANIAPFSIDPTKDVTIYITVTWGAASTANSMQLRTMVAK